MQPKDNRRSHRGPVGGSDYREPPKEKHSKPSGAWRKKYKCHKNKGDHTMVLVKPDSHYAHGMSIDEYYFFQEKKREKCLEKQREDKKKGIISGWCVVLYHWQCSACGHKNMSQNRNKYGF